MDDSLNPSSQINARQQGNGQTISHSKVNAHFQKSMAEKRIHDFQDAARMMLVHAKHHWPKAVNDVHLWPYALCMQAGIKRPKWEECARVGMYLGNSPMHACNIALVLNTETRLA